MQQDIKLFTSVHEDCALLPQFLDYYHSIGVTEIHIVVNENGRPGIADLVRKVAAKAPLPTTVDTVINQPLSDMAEALDTLRRALVRPNEYYIVADLDEFIEYPKPLPAIVKECASRGYLWARGQLIDRVTSDGSIPLTLEENIWKQFPLVGNFARTVHTAWQTKSVLQRGDQAIFIGHHGDSEVKPFSPWIARVHHFKWRGMLLIRLKDRIHIEQNNNQTWWRHSASLIRYFEKNDGRINIRDRKAKFRPALETNNYSGHHSNMKYAVVVCVILIAVVAGIITYTRIMPNPSQPKQNNQAALTVMALSPLAQPQPSWQELADAYVVSQKWSGPNLIISIVSKQSFQSCELNWTGSYTIEGNNLALSAVGTGLAMKCPSVPQQFIFTVANIPQNKYTISTSVSASIR